MDCPYIDYLKKAWDEADYFRMLLSSANDEYSSPWLKDTIKTVEKLMDEIEVEIEGCEEEDVG